MNRTGFLHAASAKTVADGLRDANGRNANNMGSIVNDGAMPMRLLLIEEEMISSSSSSSSSIIHHHPYSHHHDSQGIIGGGSLARSLVMDAAYSLAVNSIAPCRGCSTPSNNDDTIDGVVQHHHNDASTTKACRCCKVALLIPGEIKPKKSKKRRRGHKPSFLGDTGKALFPMTCVKNIIDGDGKDNNDNAAAVIDHTQCQWDQTILENIQIKYVNSLQDVIRYLTYAPSLPNHLQPLDGICVLGLGELLSRENNRNASNVMELTNIGTCISVYSFEYSHDNILYFSAFFHSRNFCFAQHILLFVCLFVCLYIVSMLADTANVLGDTRQKLLNHTNNNATSSSEYSKYCGSNVSIIATIDSYTYATIPPKVVGYLQQQWIDCIAAVRQKQANDDGEGAATFMQEESRSATHNEWEVEFQDMANPKSIMSGQKMSDTTFQFNVNSCNDETGEDGKAQTHKIVWKL